MFFLPETPELSSLVRKSATVKAPAFSKVGEKGLRAPSPSSDFSLPFLLRREQRDPDLLFSMVVSLGAFAQKPPIPSSSFLFSSFFSCFFVSFGLILTLLDS